MKAELEIQGQIRKVIIDSGTGRCLIGLEAYEQLKGEEELKPVPRKNKKRLVAAEGQRLTEIGRVDYKVTKNDKLLSTTEFGIVEKLGKTIILGNKWMKDVKTDISWKENKLIVEEQEIDVEIELQITKSQITRVNKGRYLQPQSITTIEKNKITRSMLCKRSTKINIPWNKNNDEDE